MPKFIKQHEIVDTTNDIFSKNLKYQKKLTLFYVVYVGLIYIIE